MNFDGDWVCLCNHGIDSHVGRIGERCVVRGCTCDMRPSQVARWVIHARNETTNQEKK